MDSLGALSERALRKAGKRLTPQRKLIVRVLTEAGGHLAAVDVYERARLHDASLSLSTVYRTLSILKQIGTVRELHLDQEHHHYELDDRGSHSHLVCLVCGRVIEVECDAFARAVADMARPYGFQVASAVVELGGYCAECRGRRPDPEAARPDLVQNDGQSPVPERR